MKLKDLITLKDHFTHRQRVGLLVVAGVVCGQGGLFMYLLRVHTYFISDTPSACVNYHIMAPYYATWSHSSHRRDATCSDYPRECKAQAAIGLGMKTLRQKKQRFLDEVVPKWIDEAKKNGKLIEI